MRIVKFSIYILVASFLVMYGLSPVYAQGVQYPIVFWGINAGYGQNELKSGVALRSFLRYSLEAYVPGFQLEVSYGRIFFGNLAKKEVPINSTDKEIKETGIGNDYAALSGSFHMRPFGGGVIVYIGGGGNINFLRAKTKVKERYWDDVVNDFHEIDKGTIELFNQMVTGYHVMAGIRFLLGNIGTFDVELRKFFLKTDLNDWLEEAQEEYGDKNWGEISFNAGLTVNIW